MYLRGIENQTILYTGAAGLLGRPACLELAKAEANVVALDVDSDRLSQLKDAIWKECKKDIHTFDDVDLLVVESVDACLLAIEKKFGKIDCLVNSAYPRTKDWHLKFEDVPLESWQRNVDMHLNGYFNISQRVAIQMIRQKSGNIINFGSIYGMVGPDFTIYKHDNRMTMPAAYAAIKGGIVNLTRYLASYLGPHGIRVNCISPGGVMDQQDSRFIDEYCAKVPLRRMANTDEIIGPLMFLISDLSRYMNGVILPIDGGWTAV